LNILAIIQTLLEFSGGDFRHLRHWCLIHESLRE
jgi:hypothetical protein